MPPPLAFSLCFCCEGAPLVVTSIPTQCVAVFFSEVFSEMLDGGGWLVVVNGMSKGYTRVF